VGSIQSGIEDLPDIALIEQPMVSFGGRGGQSKQTFYLDTGERLRHKDRAVNQWDFERLVLQRFPTIWQARAQCCDHAQNKIIITVVPGANSLECQNPLTPTVSSELLQCIEDFVAQRSNPFLHIEVCNPVYKPVEVKAPVLFSTQLAPHDAKDRPNNALIAYLSPWFYDEARAATGGDYIAGDHVSSFIQTRDYVLAATVNDCLYDNQSDSWPTSPHYYTSVLQHGIELAQYHPCEAPKTTMELTDE
jgi:hypothetical protein